MKSNEKLIKSMIIDESMVAASWNRVKLSLRAASRWQTSVIVDNPGPQIHGISRKSYEIPMKSYEKLLQSMIIDGSMNR